MPVRRYYQTNITSEKRNARRAAGWPSGRQWRKMRKTARRAGKPVT